MLDCDGAHGIHHLADLTYITESIVGLICCVTLTDAREEQGEEQGEGRGQERQQHTGGDDDAPPRPVRRRRGDDGILVTVVLTAMAMAMRGLLAPLFVGTVVTSVRGGARERERLRTASRQQRLPT